MPTFSTTHQPTRRGNRRDSSYDLDALHRFLFGRSSPRSHHLTFASAELAAEMLIEQRLLTRSVAKLVKAGKMRCLGREGMSYTYLVTPPQ